MAFFVEIACAGCGRTQRVRARKVVPCDGYTCSLAGCKKNPDFKLPDVSVKYGIARAQLIVTEYNPIISDPDGYVCEIIPHAAGAFSGWILRPATEEEKRSVQRAKQIRDAALVQRLRVN